MQKTWAILRRRAVFLAIVIFLVLAAVLALATLRGSSLSDDAAASLASLHARFNLVEGCIWIVAGACVLLHRRAAPAAVRAPLLTAGLAYLLFGPTDFVEIWSGAWYEPWWLFVWKAACVLALVGSYRSYFRRRRLAAGLDNNVPLDPPSPPE